jgi:hypothetical protein
MLQKYCNTSSKEIPIHASNGRVIGRVRGDTFWKSIKGSRHILQKPPSIAFDVCTLDQAEQAGAERVQVTDCETGTIYRATTAHIREKGFAFNRGWGHQIALSLDGWTKTRKGGGLQLPLFGRSNHA